MAEINVVPYIDVSLVLLIIFMVTAPLLQTGVDVELPNAQAKTVPQTDTPPLIVSVDSAGQYFIDVGDHRDEPVEADELTLRVAAVLRHKPATAVMVRGDARVGYGKVVKVMAALQEAGVPNVGLMTRPSGE
ncbi:MAG: protein TolR [Methylococcales bacterium]